ncbi:hypothetical protein QFZ67_000394 [Streptomyces sp. V1I1]|nr:hypothetical protein [Streptomyces sp. V1I1]
MPLPRAADGRLVLAVDVSPWLLPDANACADRSFCHTFGRGEGKHQMVAGWPYSIVAAVETGRTSRTAVLDAIRLEPVADVAAVTTVEIREVIQRLIVAGQLKEGDPEVLVVLDAGYDAPRIAHLLGDLPVQILGRLRSDRVMRRPTPPRVYDPGLEVRALRVRCQGPGGAPTRGLLTDHGQERYARRDDDSFSWQIGGPVRAR